MNFIESYLASAKVKRMVNIKPDPRYLIPNVYSSSSDIILENKQNYLHLLAGGSIHVEFPFIISFSAMDCCLCLYTDRGGASVCQNETSVSITEKQMTVLDCRKPFSLHSFMLPWDFKLFFFAGRDLDLYDSFLFRDTPFAYRVSEYSRIPGALDTLLSLNTDFGSYEIMEMHKNLTELLSSLSLSRIPASSSRISSAPGYLLELRDYLLHHYYEHFSLDEWEERFRINKYRICREFTAAFDIPPLKFLTRTRIEESKKMLLTTDWTVHEISSKVGYDNVNHFINIFKKNVGMTPGAFRRTVPETQSVSHSPAQ
ncbi:MAG: helix-turn-helix transcriptional regulator [Bariatricus sp.]